MTIRIVGAVLTGNGGDGLRIEGDVKVHIEDLKAHDNAGSGINILEHAPLLRSLDLPAETDPKALAALLLSLQQTPVQNREEVVKKSGLLERTGKFVLDASTFISNVVSISSSGAVQQIIQRLSSGASEETRPAALYKSTT